MGGHVSRRALGVLAVIACITAAVAFGPGVRSHLHHSATLAKAGVEPDQRAKKYFRSNQATASDEKLPASLQAAEEAYAARAYPEADVPFQLTVNSQQSWKRTEQRGWGGRGAAGQWTLAGPSYAQEPGTLTFTGAPYVDAGRVTALVVDPACNATRCRLWQAAAGGGIWRTDNALRGSFANWKNVSGSLPTQAIGTMTYDAATGTLYAGTGEPNAAVDNEAGRGIYKSTDGGDTWTHLRAVTTTAVSGPYTGDAFANRSINSIVVDPTNSSVIYVGSMSGLRGISSVLQGGVGGNPTPLPARGIYKSIDGGETFTYLNSPAGIPFPARGATNVALDPSNHNIVYAGQYGQGIYRSLNGGTTWTQIFAARNPGNPSVIERDSFAVVKLPSGATRMYVGAGDNGTFSARLYRSNDVDTLATFTRIDSTQNRGYCGSQCWYDNVVYSPPGQPDTLYLGGSYDYNNAPTWVIDQGQNKRTNGRAFLQSTDGGDTFTDQTRDATSSTNPNGMHPDQHAIAVSPTNPDIVWYGSDGGVVRADGSYSDISSQCDSRNIVDPVDLALCKQLLSKVPSKLDSLNAGLSTLQFQSLSYNPRFPANLQGGTQDNGTWLGIAGIPIWINTIWGDGGQSGFNAADANLRFNTFTGQANDANFRGGDPKWWVVITGDIAASPEGAYFYPPVIADPNKQRAGQIFQGSQSIWRTQDWGGDKTYLETHCSEFTTSSSDTNCGDFEPIGPAGSINVGTVAHPVLVPNTDLTGPFYGADRQGAFVAAIERAPSDTGTLWAATGAGRVFISKNSDAGASTVAYTRLDSLAANSPNRFISGIYPDPANPNRAWISYSGFTANTPATPGHVFEVVYNPVTTTATWTNLDGTGATAFPDIPATDIVRDTNGDLYASNDFGVMRLPSGTTAWEVSGAGLPTVEVAGLTIVPSERKLYAATHGRSAWSMTLPALRGGGDGGHEH